MFDLKNQSTLRNSAFLAGSIGLLALPALAGSPNAFSLVPSDAEVVVVIPNVGNVLSDVDAINAIMGQMGADVGMELTMVTAMIRGMPGINVDGSAVAILDMNDDWDGDPDAVILIPVSDFGALTQGRDAVDGLVEMPMGGETVFFRDLGNGFAAVSNLSDMASDFTPASHSKKEVASMLGTAGGRVFESNDVMVYVNLESLRPLMQATFGELEAQGDMIEMMAGPEAAQGFDAFMNIYKTAVNDGQAVLGGLNFDAENGIALDFGFQFNEGSESASLFNNDGDAGSYFDHVPDMDFFYAQAFDLRGEGIQKMFAGYFGLIESFDTTGMVAGMNLEAIMSQFKGGAQVMGASDVMMMNGLLANTVVYSEGADSGECLTSLKGIYDMMGEMEMPGMSLAASFSGEPEDINGVQAYAHSMTINIDPAMGGGGFGAPDPAMIMQMMYGPSRGPAGYVAKAGDGLVFTFSQDTDLLAKGVAAANGKGTMMGNKSIAAAAAMLPDNRIMEGYFGVDHVLNSVGPMLMMFGILPEFEPLESSVPLAFGMTADGGGMLIRTVLPLSTVQSVVELIPEEAFGGGDWDDEDWDDEEENDDMEF